MGGWMKNLLLRGFNDGGRAPLNQPITKASATWWKRQANQRYVMTALIPVKIVISEMFRNFWQILTMWRWIKITKCRDE